MRAICQDGALTRLRTARGHLEAVVVFNEDRYVIAHGVVVGQHIQITPTLIVFLRSFTREAAGR